MATTFDTMLDSYNKENVGGAVSTDPVKKPSFHAKPPTAVPLHTVETISCNDCGLEIVRALPRRASRPPCVPMRS